ncbi:uncharacterized protein [Diadema antillarum]|uniref:uncharacterized protein n=1 Tax=Diadema antillarum TaxID=105358 RepID=UPI003A84BC39
MDGSSMRHTIRVTVPSMQSPRAAVARQSLQTALNRSIPAQGQGVEDFTKYGKYNSRKDRAPSPRIVRTAPSGSGGAVTNEFVGRTRTGPSRQPAKTNIVDFGDVPLHPRERMHVRGIDGFFPPLKMKSGGGAGKFVIAEPMSNAWVTKPGTQEPDASSSQFSVELAPYQSDLGPDSVPSSQPSLDWLHRRNNNQPDSLSINNSPPSQDAVRHSPRTSHRSPPAPEVTGLQRKRDAPWVRAFKVKQNRNNRYKDMELGSKSMSNLDDGSNSRR